MPPVVVELQLRRRALCCEGLEPLVVAAGEGQRRLPLREAAAGLGFLTARSLGIEVAAEARMYTIEGLVDAILAMCETGAIPPRNA